MTMMLLLSDCGIAMGNEGQTFCELMINVGRRTIDWSGGFGMSLGRTPLGPDQVPYSIFLIFAK